ncbi:uncharacterized protein MONOS_13023 [Monocercomonoides exilis]|uniref:uncharacterized protein n=1 Tax=Monocercomonoides exilis TaxID=2049356 RepID=UPI00355961DA|nr:hypothetical protein MONOS_13023 [Monocercomonoides exilis]|eukprot:MONOS_13023.1-p1 / transcript=MONOS_13023.1 / gene=MONOS_13023 / organism=Monocercomonoides_exilis_PA203 / gene_product=unspecified product / transcript_product=unspecified product / location=Mono_scaffold00767:29097-29538(-) / protein_length=125 / sequence_SO=supercontig / SO=protein_coding / is_pseudo=false
MSLTESFCRLSSELENCTEIEQKQKIIELNEIIDGTSDEEIDFVFVAKTFDSISKMIEEKKLSMENTILLLKHLGFCKVLKRITIASFDNSILQTKLVKMIIKEEKKKEEKNERLFIDLCECYL